MKLIELENILIVKDFFEGFSYDVKENKLDIFTTNNRSYTIYEVSFYKYKKIVDSLKKQLSE